MKLSRPQALGRFLLVAYLGVWILRRDIGLVQPMANLRYFHYRTEAGSLTDEALYVAFFPAYRPYLAWQSLLGDRVDVHWSDRRNPIAPPGEGAYGLSGDER